MTPEQKANLDRVVASSPVVIIGGRIEEMPVIDFVTGNVSRFGLCPGELTKGRISPESLVFSEDREDALRSLGECLSSGACECTREYRLVTGTGDILPVRDYRVFHRDGSEKFRAWQSTLVDLTDRKEREDASRRTGETMAGVLAASKIWAWEYLPETGEIIGSGYFPPEGVGSDRICLSLEKLWHDILRPEDLPGVKDDLALLLAGKKRTLSGEYEFRKPGGKHGWVAVSAFPVPDVSGGVAMVTGLTIDITPVKEAHRKAASQGRRLELLHAMSLELMKAPDTDSLLLMILHKAVEFAGAGNGVLFLLEEKGTVLRHKFAIGLQEPMVGETRPAGRGMCGRALRERRPVWVKDYRTSEERLDDPRFDRITTNIVLPLFYGSHDFGAVSIHFTDECADLDESFVMSLEQFAAAASVALEKARLYEASRMEVREKTLAEERLLAHGRMAGASAEASGFLLSQDHAGSALAMALASLAEASGAGRAVLLRNLPEGDLAEVIASGEGKREMLPTVEDGPVRKADYPLLFERLASGRPYLGPLKKAGEGEGETGSIAAVPIFIRSMFWGSLALLFAGTEPRFAAGELAVLRTAAYNLAVSVMRWEAEEQVKKGYERLRKTFDDVIRTMGFIVGRKDPYTIEHQERVAALALEIGTAMGLDPWSLEGLRIASLVHDVGKVEIPGEILSKPGRLSPMEFELIKTHSRSGFDILKEIDFPWPVAEIVLQHHERMDGSGYPGGLRGEAILPEARILAVADVVEAMSSHRPYRPSLGIEAPMAEITGKRGSAYDPRAVDACLEVLRRNPGIIAGEVKTFGRGR